MQETRDGKILGSWNLAPMAKIFLKIERGVDTPFFFRYNLSSKKKEKENRS